MADYTLSCGHSVHDGCNCEDEIQYYYDQLKIAKENGDKELEIVIKTKLNGKFGKLN